MRADRLAPWRCADLGANRCFRGGDGHRTSVFFRPRLCADLGANPGPSGGDGIGRAFPSATSTCAGSRRKPSSLRRSWSSKARFPQVVSCRAPHARSGTRPSRTPAIAGCSRRVHRTRARRPSRHAERVTSGCPDIGHAVIGLVEERVRSCQTRALYPCACGRCGRGSGISSSSC